jgi:tetratricopeptide (TPR) repeat protein
MSRNIWICYRNSDSGYVGKQIYDSLKGYFKSNNVLEITDPLDPRVVIPKSKVRQGDIIVFVIGPAWLTITDENGQPLLNKTDDFVFINLLHVLLEAKITVMMVMVDGAKMPTEADLPLNLSQAFKKKPFTLTLNSTSETDINLLTHAIRATWMTNSKRSIWPVIAGAVILLLALLVVSRAVPLQNVAHQIGLLVESFDPNRAEAYADEGWIAYNQGDYEQAIEKFSLSADLKPNYASAYDGLAWAYYKLNNLELAESNFNRFVELTEGSAASYSDRGWYYYDIEDYQLAIEDFNRAISSAPDVADNYYGLGLAHDKLHDFSEALEAYQRYLELASNPEESVIERIAELQQHMK